MAGTKRVGLDLTEGSIVKKLITYAIPLLLANFVQQLYNTVDMAIIGQFVGSIGTVGVSTGGDISTFLTFFGTAFGGAAQVYISQLVGAKRQEKIPGTIGTTLTLMFFMSFVFMVICIVGAGTFLTWLNCPAEAMEQAKSYMIITALGLPFIFEYNAISGILRGMGESKRPLLFITIAAVSNIFMDLLFVVVIPLEAAGTAIATVAAQFSSFAASIVFLWRKRDAFGFDFRLKSFKMEGEHIAILMKIGLPMAARACLIQGSQMVCSATINSYGLVTSATNSVGKKISKVVNIFTNSIDQAAGAMVGQCLGAEKYDRAKKVVYITMGMCAILCTGECALALFGPKLIFRIFTADEAVLEMGVIYMRICIIKFILQVVQGPYQSMITGSGYATLGLIAGILDGVICRLSFSYGLAFLAGWGYWGFAAGDALAHIGAIIPAVIYFYSGKWRTHKLLKNK